MSRFNLMHCVPNPRMHGLNGYKEVIDTVAWGLSELGHEVNCSLNAYEPGSRNIVFGAQVLPVEFMESMPANTIIYNFEQLRGVTGQQIRHELHVAAKRFTIWDYTVENLSAWSSLGASAVIVPVGYAPILQRISKPAIQDIDALIYGLSGDQRIKAFHQLSHSGLSTVFVSGLYGEGRDSLITRSKLVLNVHLYEHKIFEFVRVSYLLANRKAVVAVVDAETSIVSDLESCVKFTTLENMVADCYRLIEDETARSALESSGFAGFSRCDIRPILESALLVS